MPVTEFVRHRVGVAKRTVGNAERGAHPRSLALRRALDHALEKASDAQRDRFLRGFGFFGLTEVGSVLPPSLARRVVVAAHARRDNTSAYLEDGYLIT